MAHSDSDVGYDCEEALSEDEDIPVAPDRGCTVQPYLYDPSASSSSSSGDDDAPDMPAVPPPAPRVGTANWCSCNGSCRPMPTELESVCCWELTPARQLCRNEGVPCITKHPLFLAFCLDRALLEFEYMKLKYFCPMDAGDRGRQEMYRYTAYRQFTWLVHKKLGRGNRVPLPSCATTRIRDEFPSSDGSYVGFKE